ncbi:MAG: hypothetical protein ACLFWL_05005 [Candidatus Brocadiia bacterium]
MKNTETNIRKTVLIEFGIILVAVGVATFFLRNADHLTPLESAHGRNNHARPLPERTWIYPLHGADFRAPFEIRKDRSSTSWKVLAVPEGNDTLPPAKASVPLTIPADGLYRIWARTKWNPPDGNSFSARIGKRDPVTVGEDQTFGRWHWVPVGGFRLTAGTIPVRIECRQDGIALDQLLVTSDPDFQPEGPVVNGKGRRSARRFEDDFSRSPGHGMDGWFLRSGEWNIAFSYDPNRIARQYSLTGKAGDGEAVALIDGGSWEGTRFSFSMFPNAASRFGAILDSNGEKPATRIAFDCAGPEPSLQVKTEQLSDTSDVSDIVRIDQWHRVTIERWAWRVAVKVDGQLIFARNDLRVSGGAMGFFVSSGEAVFDDVYAAEIHWWAEDGRRTRAAWYPAPGSAWFRNEKTNGPSLVGKKGKIEAASPPASEIILEETGPPSVSVPDFREVDDDEGVQFLRAAKDPEPVKLVCPGGRVEINRLAFRTPAGRDGVFEIGPYAFSREKVEDPSDYLDFTEEEYKEIRNSEDVDKLRRRKKMRPVVGKGGQKSVWTTEKGTWAVADGVLSAAAPGSLRHWQEVISGFELCFRIRLGGQKSAGGVELYRGDSEGSTVLFAAEDGGEKEDPALHFNGVVPGKWHDVTIDTRGNRLKLLVGEKLVREGPLKRGGGGTLRLLARNGSVAFDDLNIAIPRRQRHGRFYGFDRRETDWWREGGKWIDHGGIACVLASNWISLIAPEDSGRLWNKDKFEGGAVVAFNVEENTEWFGWNEKPSHVHHPFDNIFVEFTPEIGSEEGYRVELNADDRSHTILYRNGEEVLRVKQDGDFPMRYRGGHSPYSPRRNRISVRNVSGEISVRINGKTVLKYEDRDPVRTDRIGIGGYKTRINFSHLELQTGLEQPD